MTVVFVATADVTPKHAGYMNGMARVPCPSPGVRFPKARTVVLETICIITEQGEMLLAVSSIVAGHLSVCGLVIVMI